jgi:hypothetical protein
MPKTLHIASVTERREDAHAIELGYFLSEEREVQFGHSREGTHLRF